MKKKIFLFLILFLIFCLLICDYNKTKFVDNLSLLESIYTTFNYKFENVNHYQNLKAVDKVYCIVMPQRKEYMKQYMKEYREKRKSRNEP